MFFLFQEQLPNLIYHTPSIFLIAFKTCSPHCNKKAPQYARLVGHGCMILPIQPEGLSKISAKLFYMLPETYFSQFLLQKV